MTRPEDGGPAPASPPQYRTRLPVAIATSTLVSVILGVLGALVVRPPAVGIPVGILVALAHGAATVRKVRRRTLTVYEDVLVAQRDRHRLVVPWQSISGAQHRRHQGLLTVEELLCSGARVEAVDVRGRPCRLPRRLERHPALGRVLVSIYDKDWRRGPIGERLRQHGVKV